MQIACLSCIVVTFALLSACATHREPTASTHAREALYTLPAVDAGTGDASPTLASWPEANARDVAAAVRWLPRNAMTGSLDMQERAGMTSISASPDMITPAVRSKLEELAKTYARTFTVREAGHWNSEVRDWLSIENDPSNCYSVIVYAEKWEENPIFTFEDLPSFKKIRDPQTEVGKHGSKTVSQVELEAFIRLEPKQRTYLRRLGAGISSFILLVVNTVDSEGSTFGLMRALRSAASVERVAVLGDDRNPVCFDDDESYLTLHPRLGISDVNIASDPKVTARIVDGEEQPFRPWGRGSYLLLSKPKVPKDRRPN